jgi:hypothetical protein
MGSHHKILNNYHKSGFETCEWMILALVLQLWSASKSLKKLAKMTYDVQHCGKPFACIIYLM